MPEADARPGRAPRGGLHGSERLFSSQSPARRSFRQLTKRLTARRPGEIKYGTRGRGSRSASLKVLSGGQPFGARGQREPDDCPLRGALSLPRLVLSVSALALALEELSRARGRGGRETEGRLVQGRAC